MDFSSKGICREFVARTIILLVGLACLCAFLMAGCAEREGIRVVGTEDADGRYDEDGRYFDDPREIVCWGDSLTEGVGASGDAVIYTGDLYYDASMKSYPEILQDLTHLKTYNFGVSGATSLEIEAMQGAISTDDEVFEEVSYGSAGSSGSSEGDESSEGDASSRSSGSDRSAESSDSYDLAAYDEDGGEYYDEELYGYYDGDLGAYDRHTLEYYDEEVASAGEAHKGDILVLEIGSNGGWNSDYDELVSQYRAIIEHAGCEAYIIVGDTDDPGTSVGDLNQPEFDDGYGTGETLWEEALREAFGEHFVNTRAYLVEKGLPVTGLKATKEDAELASRGCVSPQLRADWTHLNSYGYYAQALAIYERGKQLGYWG